MEDKKDQLGSQRDLIKELNQDDIIGNINCIL